MKRCMIVLVALCVISIGVSYGQEPASDGSPTPPTKEAWQTFCTTLQKAVDEKIAALIRSNPAMEGFGAEVVPSDDKVLITLKLRMYSGSVLRTELDTIKPEEIAGQTQEDMRDGIQAELDLIASKWQQALTMPKLTLETAEQAAALGNPADKQIADSFLAAMKRQDPAFLERNAERWPFLRSITASILEKKHKKFLVVSVVVRNEEGLFDLLQVVDYKAKDASRHGDALAKDAMRQIIRRLPSLDPDLYAKPNDNHVPIASGIFPCRRFFYLSRLNETAAPTASRSRTLS